MAWAQSTPGAALQPHGDPPEQTSAPNVAALDSDTPPPPRVSEEVWALNSFTGDRGTGGRAGPGLSTHFGGSGSSALQAVRSGVGEWWANPWEQGRRQEGQSEQRRRQGRTERRKRTGAK